MGRGYTQRNHPAGSKLERRRGPSGAPNTKMRKEMIREEQRRFDEVWDRFIDLQFENDRARYVAEKTLLHIFVKKNPHLIWLMEDDWLTTVGERYDQLDLLIAQS